jgi:hypothetical protein
MSVNNPMPWEDASGAVHPGKPAANRAHGYGEDVCKVAFRKDRKPDETGAA